MSPLFYAKTLKGETTMEALDRKQSKEMVEKVLRNDSEAFNQMFKQFDRLVWQHTIKWHASIGPISMGMYESTDVHNELWEHIWRNLPKYNSEKSNLLTWLYLVCNSKAGMLYRNLSMAMRCPEVDNLYLYDTVSETEDTIEFIDMIMDPRDAFSDTSLDEMKIYDYIYILKDFVEGLGYNQKVVYLQSIRHDMTEHEISGILGISQSYVCRIKNNLMKKALKLWNKIDNSKIDHRKADKFALILLGSETDDELSDKLDCSLAVIKVCREVLSIANLYSGNEVKTWG